MILSEQANNLDKLARLTIRDLWFLFLIICQIRSLKANRETVTLSKTWWHVWYIQNTMFRFVPYQFVKDLYPPNTRQVQTYPAVNNCNFLFQLRADEHFPLRVRRNGHRSHHLFQGVPISPASLSQWWAESQNASSVKVLSFSLLLPQLCAPLLHSVPQWSCPSGRLLRLPPSSSCPSTSRRYHERADGDAAPQNLNLRFLNDSFFKGFRR